MKNLKTLSVAALLVASSFSLTACDDRDIAFGAGVVVGAIISDDSSHHHHHHRPNPPCYRRCHRHYSVETLSSLTPAERVSVKYGLSSEQAEILTSHLLRTQAGDLSAMAELGFEKSDLAALFEGQNPSASTLEILSSQLNLDISQAHELIQDIKADALIARDTLM